eukprot:TRINITY_DN5374_c0_g1_i1.p1 TRINITY_DN5374_c0_g1~~TRINITY_DN5374_c0_g1_i1.p1  ORF type:complete len:119 (-),score=34.05 TRINITY_DN5374_c0_g1_i1:306-662(-)
MVKTIIPLILVLSIFAIASGFDQTSDEKSVDSNLLKEIEDHKDLRKTREAVAKKGDKAEDGSSKKGRGEPRKRGAEVKRRMVERKGQKKEEREREKIQLKPRTRKMPKGEQKKERKSR